MEKGNQPESGSRTAIEQQTPGGGGAAACGGAPPPGGQGATPEPGTGTGTAPTGTPPPVAPGGGGGGSQADQSGPDDRPWEILEPRTQNPDGTWTRTDTDGEGALRHTTYDGQGNIVGQEIVENPNTGGWQPPADEPPGRTYETDGGTPPVGGPEPFSDVPPDPNLPEYKSWRDMPAQDIGLEEGRSLSLDGKGGLEYQEGGRTFRHEGNNWVDTQTGERAPKGVGRRASGAQSRLESGLIPGAQR